MGKDFVLAVEICAVGQWFGRENNEHFFAGVNKAGTWNIPEHSGTFRNIPEQGKLSQNKRKKKERKEEKAIKETTKKQTNKQTNKV